MQPTENPMSNLPAPSSPRVFTARWPQSRPSLRVVPPDEAPHRATFRPGRKAILLSVTNALGAGVAVTFTPARGGVHVWRSLSPQRERLEHVRTLPGPFTPLAIARHLAAGAVDPVVDHDLAEAIEVDGVDGCGASLLRLAWSRTGGALDPRLTAVLRLSQGETDDLCDRMGLDDAAFLLEAGEGLLDQDATWLERWKAGVDAEVDRRAAVEGAGEARRRELRGFVEECLLVLGRVPRPDESPSCWDGTGVRDDPPGERRRRELGLTRTGHVRRYRIRVHFWTAADTYGYSDFGPGPGWYFVVANPNPDWRFCDPEGPFQTPEEAWSAAQCTGVDEE
jgi:hypothetical protein